MPEPLPRLSLMGLPAYHAVKETTFDGLPLPIRAWATRCTSLIAFPENQHWFRHHLTAAAEVRQAGSFDVYFGDVPELSEMSELWDPFGKGDLPDIFSACWGNPDIAIIFKAILVVPGDPLPAMPGYRSVTLRRLPVRSRDMYYYLGQDPVTRAVHWAQIRKEGQEE